MDDTDRLIRIIEDVVGGLGGKDDEGRGAIVTACLRVATAATMRSIEPPLPDHLVGPIALQLCQDLALLVLKAAQQRDDENN